MARHLRTRFFWGAVAQEQYILPRMQPLGILDLLRLRGFDASKPTRFVRHQGGDYDIRELIRAGWLDKYQCYQSRPVFDRCEQVVSFVGDEGTKARLWGVHRVAGPRRDGRAEPFPAGCPFEEWTQDPYFYDLQHVPGYEDLEKRVVIEWGRGTLAWCQKPSNKEVFEIYPPGGPWNLSMTTWTSL